MFLFKLYEKLVKIVALPCYLPFFFDRKVGSNYKVGFLRKIKLIFRFKLNTKRIPTATNWLEHVRIATQILSIPPSVDGDIVECGCFKGGSSANLSVICGLTGRKLIVCDSFEGLPTPDESDSKHYSVFRQGVDHYEKGFYKGALEEVKANIEKYGNIDACKFVKGYFENSLPGLEGQYVMAFLDVDLHKSLEDCLVSLWPLLKKGSYLFTHEAQDLAFVSKFFDKEWWRSTFDEEAPGLVGAGSGLPLGIGTGSGLGYVIKHEGMDSISEGWDSVSDFRDSAGAKELV